jgi:WXG100 family type VII secretion target
MATEFDVTTESLGTIATTLRGEGARIGEALSTLEAAVSKLEGQWDGAARAAYSDAQQQWTARFADMKRLLTAIADATDEIASGYENADAAAAAAFGE